MLNIAIKCVKVKEHDPQDTKIYKIMETINDILQKLFGIPSRVDHVLKKGPNSSKYLFIFLPILIQVICIYIF